MSLLSHAHQRPRQLAGGEGAHRHVHGLAELHAVLRGGEVVPAHAQLEGGSVGGDAQRRHGHAEEVYGGEGVRGVPEQREQVCPLSLISRTLFLKTTPQAHLSLVQRTR